MKKKFSQLKKENIRFETNKRRPEIRDDLDSRMKEEQHRKGDDTTHNKKEPDNRKKPRR